MERAMVLLVGLGMFEGALAAPEGESAEALPLGDEGADIEEITVWGEAIEQARQAVIGRIVGLGYDRAKDRDGRTVFKHDLGWKGKVVLYDDGMLATRRRGLSGRKVEPIPKTRFRPYVLCIVQPTYCVDAGSWYLSERRWRGIEDVVARETAAELGTLGDRMADASVAQQLEVLPDRLERLWQEGEPLMSASALRTYRERRSEILAFWDSRTETAWGVQVREAVAAFVRGVVQRSDHPFTPSERERFDEVRRSSSPFPW